MRQRVVDLQPAASVAPGGATAVLSDTDKWTLIVSGTFVATLQLQVFDGTNWVKVGADITAPGVVDLNTQALSARINTSAFTSGTPKATVFLRESQQQF